MSFGFGVGDFAGSLQLAWTLYTNCYKVAKGAPQDFRSLVQEINILHSSIKLLQEEAVNPDSTLVRAGQDRVEMVNRIMDQVDVTLRELEKHAKKYEKLGKVHSSSIRKWWTGVKWSAEASELDALRNKLVYHNGVISLLLTSCGNSSLQRLETMASKVEKGVSDIKGMIRSSEAPIISVIEGDRVSTISLSATLMKNAEIGRKWSAIGVEEWIQAGSWWLLKSQMNLYTGPPSDRKINKQGYADLMKAAWILIDIITRHPQLDFLETSMGYGVELLVETIRRELQNISTLGLSKPSLDDLNACDLAIWETEAKEATLQPGEKSFSSSDQAWMTEHEHVLFQRFVYYQPNSYTSLTPCIVLFLMHKKDRKARIVLRDQSWVTLATFIVGSMKPCHAGNILEIGDQKIKLSTPEDVLHVCSISDAVEEYLFYCKDSDNDLGALGAVVLLFSVKNNYRDLVRRLIGDEDIQGLEKLAESHDAHFSARIRLGAQKLALEFMEGDTCDTNQRKDDADYESLLWWALREQYISIAVLLVEWKGVLTNEEEMRVHSPLHNAARNGNSKLARLLLSEHGANIDIEDDGWTALELAIRNGHEITLKELLEIGAVYRDLYKDSFNGLQMAAGRGDQAIVDRLLEIGVNVNSPAADQGGRTALQAAAGGGHIAVVNRLLEVGADVNAKPSAENGRTALQAAAGGGHITVVNRLLEIGAGVNAEPSEDRCTALQAAAGGGHIAVVNRLLEVGADVNANPSISGGRTALQAAAEGGHIAVVNRLLEVGADVNAEPSEDRCTALQAAAGGGHITVVNRLLEVGADVNAEPSKHNGRTALQAAAGGGHIAVVNRLLEVGADINAPTSYNNGHTELQAAAGEGHIAVVNRLLEVGADVNANPSISGGRTALQAAAGGGHIAVVNRLLEVGADVNAEPSKHNGRTALQAAAGGGHIAVVNRLLEVGADINAPTSYNNGHTELQAAAGGGHITVVNRLLEVGADVNANPSISGGRTALQAAAGGGHIAVVNRLLEVGADVNAKFSNYNGRTALQAAAGGGHIAVVNRLLEVGADVNANPSISGGRTALQAAAEGGHIAVVNRLLEVGADVNAEPSKHNGRTALQAAAKGGHIAVVNRLLEVGADVNAKPLDWSGYTALQAAAEGGHIAVVDILRKAGARG